MRNLYTTSGEDVLAIARHILPYLKWSYCSVRDDPTYTICAEIPSIKNSIKFRIGREYFVRAFYGNLKREFLKKYIHNRIVRCLV